MHAYRLKLRDYAAAQFRHEQVLWTIAAAHVGEKAGQAPDLPAILRD